MELEGAMVSREAEGEWLGKEYNSGALRGCFVPHVRFMLQVHKLYPFVKINCPGPRTDPLIPELDREYIPYKDQGFFGTSNMWKGQ